MKKRLTFYFLFCSFIGFTNISYAQDTTQVVDNSLSGQYQGILLKSKTLNGYKLVRPDRITSLWKSFNDTLSIERSKLQKAEADLAAQKQSSLELQNNLGNQTKSLAESNSKVDSIEVVGMSIAKGTYNMVMWGIVLLLVLTLTFLFVQSANNRKEAHYRIKLYEELSGEFQSYKVKANEKEKKLARELQDERNKLDDLKSGNSGLN